MSNPGDLNLFISKAMAYCWDETHGYSQEYDGMGNPGFDCSGLIGRCLYEAGFNYPSYHVGTMNMDDNPMSTMNTLGAAGFNLIHVTDLNNIPQLQHGDIITLNSYLLDWTLNGGHAFIYAENVLGYTSTMSGDSDSYPDTTGTVAQAKIEASTYRSWHDYNTNADNPNSEGACTQVWVHAFSTLIPSHYDPQDANYHNYVSIARWGGPSGDKDIFFMKRIRDDQFNTDSWANKFIDIGM